MYDLLGMTPMLCMSSNLTAWPNLSGVTYSQILGKNVCVNIFHPPVSANVILRIVKDLLCAGHI